ncbi:MAG: SCP2 sterol-binding domain-containing protein [Bacteroidetes bacterium]|nr:SCP2 sterol-binding domain-containing protein [Bacteroidota bacterium]MBK8658649.1 SCP2 sterol-binding domain-containing protein [Bacteroidota bacterium]
MAFETILANLTASASKAAALGKTLKFDLGDNKIFLDGSGSGNVVSTEDKDADCTISVSQDDLLGMMTGSVNPMMAFMSGKIKVQGDMSIAMKLQSLLK